MKITVHINGKTYAAKPPYADADHVEVSGIDECPACHHRGILKVSGKGNHIDGHDTYKAEGIALCCKVFIGAIRVKVSTIFGLEEDSRVLNGRCRVY